MRNARRLQTLFPLLFAVIAAFHGVQSAPAQGTGGLLPDPISTTRVLEYSERLELDSAQREILFAAHEMYLDRFLLLRRTKIQDLLESEWSAVFTWPSIEIVDPKVVRDFHRNHKGILDSIAAMEAELFNLLKPELNEVQSAALGRLELQRGRDRLLAVRFASSWLFSVHCTRFEEALERAEISEGDLQGIEPILRSYERRLVRQLDDLFDGATSFHIAYVKECVARGLKVNASPHKQIDPDQFDREEFERRFPVWWALRGDVMKAAKTILNEQAELETRIARMLPPEDGNRFRIACQRTRKPGGDLTAATTLSRWPGLRHLALALEHANVPDAAREELESLLESWHVEWGALHDEMRAIEADYRGGFSFTALSEEDLARDREGAALISEISKKQFALAERIEEALPLILGEDAAEEVIRTVEAERAARKANRHPETRDAILLAGHSEYESALHFLPQQITPTDFELYADILAIDESQRTVAGVLFEDYLNALRRIRREKVAQLPELKPRWSRNPETGKRTPPSPQEVSEFNHARREISSAVRQLGDGFLRDLAAVFDGGRADARLRLIELHSACRFVAASRRPSHHEGYTEYRADLIRALEDAELDHDALGRCRQIILANAVALRTACDDEYRAHVRTTVAQVEADYAAWQREQKGDDDAAGQHEQALVRMRAAFERWRAARVALVERKRTLLDQITATITDTEARSRFRLAFLRDAYPHVFEDPRRFLAVLDVAGSIAGDEEESPELPPDVMQAWRSAFNEVAQRICEVYGESPHQGIWTVGDVAAWEDYRRRDETIEKLAFERDELVTRALARLKDLLGERRFDAVVNEARAGAAVD